MKLGHLIYKVGDLKEGVERFKKLGFCVEYGTLKNPYNALIYFSEGPYIELLSKTGVPVFIKYALRFFGKRALVIRLNEWDSCRAGVCDLCLEGDEEDFKKVKDILTKNHLSFNTFSMGRKDSKQRRLKYKVLFPKDISLPFFMTHFDNNPRPINFTHPNGISRITSVDFPMKDKETDLLKKICDDPNLSIQGEDISFAFDKPFDTTI